MVRPGAIIVRPGAVMVRPGAIMVRPGAIMVRPGVDFGLTWGQLWSSLGVITVINRNY